MMIIEMISLGITLCLFIYMTVKIPMIMGQMVSMVSASIYLDMRYGKGRR